RKHAQISYHDPFVPMLQASRRYDFKLRSVPLTQENLAAADAVLIATDHSAVDYDFVVRHSHLIVDTRNATRNVSAGRERIILACRGPPRCPGTPAGFAFDPAGQKCSNPASDFEVEEGAIWGLRDSQSRDPQGFARDACGP